MEQFQNLTLIGTSHIAQQSVDEVKKSILRLKPDIIALELDQTRFQALLQKKKRKLSLKDLPKIGLKGYLFALIGAYIQRKLGQIVKVQPGSEMITAINLAKKNNLKLALIDQPLEITLKRFSQELTWKERFRFLVDLFMGFFFKKRELKKYHLQALDLTKVPEKELIDKLIKSLKSRYPSIYLVLVKERNQVLAKNLARLVKKNPEEKILGIVGAGHQAEILKLIKRNINKN